VRVLLDENIAHNLRRHLSKHQTITVAYMGWGGLKNVPNPVECLELAEFLVVRV
jgi:hypothetical protein